MGAGTQSIGSCQTTGVAMRAGIKLETDLAGDGREAMRGDMVTVCYDLFLNRGDRIQSQQTSTFTIGKRDVIAGLEYEVEGMRVGGRRRFRVGPHLAYRDAGVADVVPSNAVLIFDIELLAVERDS